MATSQHDTQAFLEATLAGDAQAREKLFSRCLPRVRQVIALRLGVPTWGLPPQADDVVQETLLSALQGLTQFERRTMGSFHNWVAQIAETRLRGEMRERLSSKPDSGEQRFGDLDLSATLFPSGDRSPSSHAALKEQRARLEAALLALPGVYQRAIVLRDIVGMDHSEMARELKRSEANCRKIYQRAREMLIRRLGQMRGA